MLVRSKMDVTCFRKRLTASKQGAMFVVGAARAPDQPMLFLSVLDVGEGASGRGGGGCSHPNKVVIRNQW